MVSVSRGPCGWRNRPVCKSISKPFPSRARAADEILLCGSTGLLWAARSFADREFPQAVTGPVLQSLQHLWMEEIGLDYIQQAMNAVQTSPTSEP